LEFIAIQLNFTPWNSIPFNPSNSIDMNGITFHDLSSMVWYSFQSSYRSFIKWKSWHPIHVHSGFGIQ